MKASATATDVAPQADRPKDSTTSLVSVVMPACNAEKYLREALDSVLAQTHSNLELIVIDDASTDLTADILNSYADLRLKIITNPSRKGAGLSRDIGIAASCGQWIAFIDADDAWLPTRLEKFLAVTSDRHDNVVFDNVMECSTSNNGKLTPRNMLRSSTEFHPIDQAAATITAVQLIDSERMLLQPLFSRQTLMDTLARHSNHRFGEDTYFLLKLLSRGADLIYVRQPLYLYRVSSLSASSAADKYLLLIEILKECLMDFRDHPAVLQALNRKITRTTDDHHRFSLSRAIKDGRFSTAIRIVLSRPMTLIQLASHNRKKLLKRLSRAYR